MSNDKLRIFIEKDCYIRYDEVNRMIAEALDDAYKVHWAFNNLGHYFDVYEEMMAIACDYYIGENDEQP